MLARVAAFEFRYQAGSALFRAVALLLMLATFADMAIFKLVKVGGGNVLYNSPHAVIVTHLGVSLLFLFVGAAFASNAVVRDDQTGFGPILRSTRIGRSDYLFGRFLGAFAICTVLLAMATFGAWLGTLMPFADASMLGPNKLAGFALGFGLFALPNVLVISAILFALATATRSMAGTFVGVILLFITYIVGQRLMEGQPGLAGARVLADPFGMSAYMAASRYYTAAQLNAGAVPLTPLILQSRALWVGLALVALVVTHRLFRFTERGPSRRQQRRLQREAEIAAKVAPTPAAAIGAVPEPRFGAGTARAQFIARTAMEVRFVVRSPLFLILLALAFLTTLPGLWSAVGWMDVPLYPIASVLAPNLEGSYATVLIILAAFYGGELVWRERERRMHEIVDATPLSPWALMLPKMLGLSLVLVATLLVGTATAFLVQVLKGGVEPTLGTLMAWSLAPMAFDAVLLAVLAVFLQALSPGKYAGWGVMVLYIGLLLFGPAAGLDNPLLIYGRVPGVPLTGMNGPGNFAEAAWWFRAFWTATAVLLLVAAHLLWPRGAEPGLVARLRFARTRFNGATRVTGIAATVVLVATGGWIVYNTRVLNGAGDSDPQRYLAEYEQRYIRYVGLPQPTVRHVQLDVDLFPEAIRADVRGRYRLVNETGTAIDRVHVRLMQRGLELLVLNLPGARLEGDDARFGYRIYRLDAPMQPGESRWLEFHTRRQQVGFRASGTEADLAPNGTDLNTMHLTPRIGMSDVGLIDDPAARRKYGLPTLAPFPRLEELAATRRTPGGDLDWTTTDITVSTPADQIPVAPGRQVAERVQDGRRTVRFVADRPIKNMLSIQSARYAVRRETRDGIDYRIYFHPAHAWNVSRMMTAMQASMDYYRHAFGPYPFAQIRIVERPDAGGGQAFPGSVAVGEGISAMDLRDPAQLDMVTMLTAHELAHQWWGQQVTGARMQGGSLLYESLSQYSALMVLRRLKGEAMAARFLRFQVDRYLAGRRTQVLEEQPLARAGFDQDYINYGKGALVLYLLQHRIGEDAVNRALHRFVARYRFTAAPYPRSLDLIAFLRAEAKTPSDQALITDLFERITLYDFAVDTATASKRADGRWDVSVHVTARKFYADGQGNEREAPLDDLIDIGLFATDLGEAPGRRADVIAMAPQRVRTGRQVVRFVANRLPRYAAVNPQGLYIERNLEDNAASVAIRNAARASGNR